MTNINKVWILVEAADYSTSHRHYVDVLNNINMVYDYHVEVLDYKYLDGNQYLYVQIENLSVQQFIEMYYTVKLIE